MFWESLLCLGGRGLYGLSIHFYYGRTYTLGAGAVSGIVFYHFHLYISANARTNLEPDPGRQTDNHIRVHTSLIKSISFH